MSYPSKAQIVVFKSKICYLHVNSWINKYIYQYINFTQVLIVTYMKIWIYNVIIIFSTFLQFFFYLKRYILANIIIVLLFPIVVICRSR
jgi:hypothetical protein